MHYGEVSYGDEELLEEIINPFFRAQKKAGIVKDYKQYVKEAEVMREYHKKFINEKEE